MTPNQYYLTDISAFSSIKFQKVTGGQTIDDNDNYQSDIKQSEITGMRKMKMKNQQHADRKKDKRNHVT